jgi:hypothetical protein
VITFRKIRKKKKKEEVGSPGRDSDPGPLPLKVPTGGLPSLSNTSYNEVTGSKVLPLPPSSSPPVQEEGTNVLSSKPSQGSSSFFINWLAFQDYLSKTCNNSNTAKVRMCYAKKFYYVLFEEEADDLLAIESEQKRLNVMKSLILLSRSFRML